MLMCQGKVVEQGSTEQIFHYPQQEYTRELIASAYDLELAEAV